MVLLTTLAGPYPRAFAQAPASPAPSSASEAQKALEARRNELQATEGRAKSIQKDLSQINEDRERLNARLLETGDLVHKSEARLSAIEGQLAELEAKEKVARASLNQSHDKIAKLLAALQRMGRNPPPVMITRREDALEMVRSAKLLAATLPEMRTQALALAERLNDLVRVMTEIRVQADKLRTETARHEEARIRLSGLLETKKKTVTERQEELSQVRAAHAEIAKSVTDLNELIAKFDQVVTQNTGLAAYEEEARRQVAEAESKTSPTPPGSPSADAKAPDAATPPAAPSGKDAKVAAFIPPPLKPGVVELAPGSSATSLGDPGRMKPTIAFQLAKSRLPLPAQGKRILTFGEKMENGRQSKGLVLETRSNGIVTSPCDGWIVYAGEFRSYRQLLIINAGGGYHMLLAGLSRVDVTPGQFVVAAEPVGSMGSATPSGQDGARSNAPELYIELRKDGRPIDPDPWWVADLQKVQG